MTDKIYIFMRRDLNMRRGKEIAQACHAVMGLGASDRPVITLKAMSEDSLLGLERLAFNHALRSYLVRDAGLTEIPPDTPTCIAILGTPEGEQYHEWQLY